MTNKRLLAATLAAGVNFPPNFDPAQQAKRLIKVYKQVLELLDNEESSTESKSSKVIAKRKK